MESRRTLYSAPSFQLLRNEAMEVEHWNMRNPAREQRIPLVTQILAEPAAAGPIIAVSDWIRAWPDMISRWVPDQAWRSLGTDGFGRSDTRDNLRDFFGIDARHIAAAVLAELARDRGDLREQGGRRGRRARASTRNAAVCPWALTRGPVTIEAT